MNSLENNNKVDRNIKSNRSSDCSLKDEKEAVYSPRLPNPKKTALKKDLRALNSYNSQSHEELGSVVNVLQM